MTRRPIHEVPPFTRFMWRGRFYVLTVEVANGEYLATEEGVVGVRGMQWLKADERVSVQLPSQHPAQDLRATGGEGR